jgi:hypothetical protein
MDELIPLSLLELDCPAPPIGWAAELANRGVAILEDDLGRRAVPRSVARDLLAEHRENEARKARHRAEQERLAVETDQRFRASLPAGIPAGAVPQGISAAQLMMYSDPMGEESRRESMVEHSLKGGGIVFHSIEGATSAGGAS